MVPHRCVAVLASIMFFACSACDGGDGGCYGVVDCEIDPPCIDPSAPGLAGACHAPPYDMTCVGGHIVDNRGCPKVCQSVVACTEGTCFFGRADADGWFTVGIGATGASDISIYFPSPTEGQGHHSPFCHYTELCDGAIHFCDDFVLYDAPTSGMALPEAPSVTDPNPLPAEVRVEASDGGALILHAGDEVDLPLFVPDWIALTRFPLGEHVPCFVDPARLPLALYVVTPVDTYVIEPGTHLDPVLRTASLDLPNETGLGAGTAVDIYIVGGVHPQDAGLLEGEWSRVAGATVTGDGSRIQTAATEGISYLTWIGVYLP